MVSNIFDMNYDTVDGRNPAPPEIDKTLQIMVDSPYQLVQDSSINSIYRNLMTRIAICFCSRLVKDTERTFH